MRIMDMDSSDKILVVFNFLIFSSHIWHLFYDIQAATISLIFLLSLHLNLIIKIWDQFITLYDENVRDDWRLCFLEHKI